MTCKELFESMSERFLPETAGDWEAKVLFNIGGEAGGNWVVTISNGAASVAEGTAEDATATVNVDDQTWIAINTGQMEATAAFFSGQITIDGNMADVMRINTSFKKLEG